MHSPACACVSITFWRSRTPADTVLYCGASIWIAQAPLERLPWRLLLQGPSKKTTAQPGTSDVLRAVKPSSEITGDKTDQNDRVDPQKGAAYWPGQHPKQPHAKSHSYQQVEPASRTDYDTFLKHPGKSFDEVEESIPLLQRAIKETHGCASLHIESLAVKAVFNGQTAWEGTVEVFGLIDHPKAKRAFAWSYQDGNQNKTVAVLAIPPTDTAQNAVKMAIASKRRAKKWLSVLAKCLPKPKKIIEKASN